MTEANDPSSPVNYVVSPATGNIYNSKDDGLGGLTKREHFAAMAMQSIISGIYSSTEAYTGFMNVARDRGYEPERIDDFIALDALEKTEALINALNSPLNKQK